MSFLVPQEYFAPENPVNGSMPHAYTPTVPLRLISETAWHLGADNEAELQIHPYYEPYITGAAGASILRNIINQTRDRDGNTLAPHFESMIGTSEACSAAEPRLLAAIRHPEYVGDAEQSIRIVNDEAGEPLLIQKNVDRRIKGIRLGLSLQELIIGNTTWPAGTLLQVRSPHKVEHAEPVTVISADRVDRVGILRLSCFTLPLDERAVFLEQDGYSSTDTRVIGSITMDEIRERVSALTSI
jgi:hypothetical protein